MKKHSVFTLSVVCIVLLSIPTVSAQLPNDPSVFPSMQDAFITSGSGANNGDNTLMKLDFSTVEGWSRSLVQFDLRQISKDAIVNSATLALCITGRSPEVNKECLIYQVTSEWSEYEVTSLYRQTGVPWNDYGGDYKPEDAVSTYFPLDTGYYYIDVTEIVRNWIENDEPNYGFLIRANEEALPYWVVQFGTKEKIDENGAMLCPPLLEIDWEQMPARTERGRIQGVCSYVLQGGVTDSGAALQIQVKNLKRSDNLEVEITYNIRGNPETPWTGSPITLMEKASWEGITSADSTESFTVGDLVDIELIIDGTHTIFESILLSSHTLH